MNENESIKPARSALSDALTHLVEVKFGEFLESGFIKSISQLQRILVLFVLMGIGAGGALFGLGVFVMCLTYVFTESPLAVAYAGIIYTVISLGVSLWFFLKVLGQEFWLDIFNLKKQSAPADLHARLENA